MRITNEDLKRFIYDQLDRMVARQSMADAVLNAINNRLRMIESRLEGIERKVGILPAKSRSNEK